MFEQEKQDYSSWTIHVNDSSAGEKKKPKKTHNLKMSDYSTTIFASFH